MTKNVEEQVKQIVSQDKKVIFDYFTKAIILF